MRSHKKQQQAAAAAAAQAAQVALQRVEGYVLSYKEKVFDLRYFKNGDRAGSSIISTNYQVVAKVRIQTLSGLVIECAACEYKGSMRYATLMQKAFFKGFRVVLVVDPNQEIHVELIETNESVPRTGNDVIVSEPTGNAVVPRVVSVEVFRPQQQ